MALDFWAGKLSIIGFFFILRPISPTNHFLRGRLSLGKTGRESGELSYFSNNRAILIMVQRDGRDHKYYNEHTVLGTNSVKKQFFAKFCSHPGRSAREKKTDSRMFFKFTRDYRLSLQLYFDRVSNCRLLHSYLEIKIGISGARTPTPCRTLI